MEKQIFDWGKLNRESVNRESLKRARRTIFKQFDIITQPALG